MGNDLLRLEKNNLNNNFYVLNRIKNTLISKKIDTSFFVDENNFESSFYEFKLNERFTRKAKMDFISEFPEAFKNKSKKTMFLKKHLWVHDFYIITINDYFTNKPFKTVIVPKFLNLHFDIFNILSSKFKNTSYHMSMSNLTTSESRNNLGFFQVSINYIKFKINIAKNKQFYKDLQNFKLVKSEVASYSPDISNIVHNTFTGTSKVKNLALISYYKFKDYKFKESKVKLKLHSKIVSWDSFLVMFKKVHNISSNNSKMEFKTFHNRFELTTSIN